MVRRTVLTAGALAVVLVAGFLVMTLGGAADAQIGTPSVHLYTGALRVEEVDASSGQGPEFRCHLVNVSGGNRSVRIRIKDQSGAVVDDTGSLSLGAGDILRLSTEVADNGVPGHASPPLYCHFTTSGSKADVRGVATIGSSVENSYSDMVAAPAT